MTIKTKLTLNLLLVLVVVCAVAATSIIGMGFVKNKLYYLTERSTPFQMRTVEFQKTIQAATSDLMKLTVSKNMDTYKKYRAETEKSLSEVRKSQEVLESISGGSKMETYDELGRISSELFDITEKRLHAEEEATSANKVITQKLNDTSGKIKELDVKIRSLQSNRQGTLTTSMEDTKVITTRLRDLDQLKVSLKDLQLAIVELTKAQDKKAVIISRSKANNIITRALQNKHFTESKKHYSDLKGIAEKIEEMVKAQSAYLSQQGDETRNNYETVRKDVSERLSVLAIEVEQEVELANEKYAVEVNKQGNTFTQTSVANSILISNSELVTFGLSIESLTARLFIATSTKDLDNVAASLRKTYENIDAVGKTLDKSMKRLDLKDEPKILQAAMKSLSVINGLLFARDGVYEKLKNELAMAEKALSATEKLMDVVMKQAVKGKETVITAKGEQEKAIGSVNKMTNYSMLVIIAISLAAIVIGITFGIWIYRSIQKPLKDIIGVANEIAKSNLTCEAKEGTDELGKLAQSMNLVVQSFGNVISKILVSVNSSVQVLNELRNEAEKTSDGAGVQSDQAHQIATAAEEMSQTINDIARNASTASATSGEAMETAQKGKSVADGAVDTVNRVYTSTEELAEMVSKLNGRVGEIGDIVVVIKDIADQTNLLALNAAIEAARAGEQGRGFAVVADEVRKLAERTITATSEISHKISAVQAESEKTTQSMGEASDEVKKANDYIRQVGESLNHIVDSVQNARDQVTKIAVAVEQQSATAAEVANNSEKTSSIAEEQKASAVIVMKEIGGLIVATEELRNTTMGFQTKGNQLLVLDLAQTDVQLFVSKIAANLKGNTNLDYSRLTDHHACNFGKWYDSKGKEICGNLNSFKAIAAPHEKIHRLAKEIGEASNSGNKDKAINLLKDMEQTSEQVFLLLNEIKKEYA